MYFNKYRIKTLAFGEDRDLAGGEQLHDGAPRQRVEVPGEDRRPPGRPAAAGVGAPRPELLRRGEGLAVGSDTENLNVGGIEN